MCAPPPGPPLPALRQASSSACCLQRGVGVRGWGGCPTMGLVKALWGEERGVGDWGSLTECFAETGWGAGAAPTHEVSRSPGERGQQLFQIWCEIISDFPLLFFHIFQCFYDVVLLILCM